MHEYPDIDDIAAFVAVAEHASFAAAGRQLSRDATIVSRRVQALEARLGVRLFARSTRRVALTEAGAAYLTRVQPILRELGAATREAAAYASGAPRGRLRVAAPSTFGRMWLAPLVPVFLARYPEVTVDISFSNRFVDLIGEGFDVAVRLGVLPDSRLVARQVARRRRLVCAAPAYLERHGEPRTPEALTDHPCMIFSGFPTPYRWQFAHASGEVRTVSIDGPVVSDDAEALVATAVAGIGIVMATDWLVGRELAEGRLVPLLHEWTVADEGAIYVVMPSAGGASSKTRAFADLISERMHPPPWLSHQR
ncbi:LysR family transcriptional regulator [Trinickia sp. LjRoot230]|uniref:LysR family transcriptional regulator n=1 Tax=Trinickia sp. LjRoot230 TaxID=3342288 RepID=UPI003ED018C0